MRAAMRDNPTYRQVCSDTTNHAEVVQVTFDPAKVSYAKLRRSCSFKMHDPTQMNRQGPDVGTQYRSAIFTHSPEQERVAREERKKRKHSAASSAQSSPSIEPAQLSGAPRTIISAISRRIAGPRAT